MLNSVLNTELIKEKEFQDIINNDEIIQKGIAESIFNNTHVSVLFDKETEYINGITSDFTLLNSDNEILSILECKRPDIGVTEYVRGIGQLYQYEYFFKKNILPKKITDSTYNQTNIDEFKNVLVIPSSFINNTSLNIAMFNYPKTSLIIEINLNNKNVRKINRDELNKLANNENNTIGISQYYLRDNRIFEYYIALKYIQYWHVRNPRRTTIFNRTNAEGFLRNFNTINNGNWRNAFITLSSLGFIDGSNNLTTSGNSMVNLELEEFIFTIYKDYVNPYVDILMDLFNAKPDFLNKSNIEIANELKSVYNDKDILFLTQSNGRYISSWLNIMRDDLGCLDFQPRSKDRSIVYRINQLRDEVIKQKIKDNNTALSYVNSYYDLL